MGSFIQCQRAKMETASGNCDAAIFISQFEKGVIGSLSISFASFPLLDYANH
jgi:hypothetical protein